MKDVRLKKINIINFKGIKSLEIEFGNLTNIYGDNATGKTTIFDAFTWVLFGKDSNDSKEFNVKTLDINGNAIPKLEHEVSILLDVDNEEICIKRILKEKWVKKRGESIAEFTGHETILFYNDVPMLSNEFKNKIDSIIDESLFKMITNSEHFNNMKWQDRRKVLIDIAGEIDSKKLYSGDKSLLQLHEMIEKQRKSVDEIKKEVLAKKRKIKEELDVIPARIDEIQRNIPAAPDEASIEKNIRILETEIASIDKQIEDKTAITQKALKAAQEIQRKKFEIHEKLTGIEFRVRAASQKNEKTIQMQTEQLANKRNYLAKDLEDAKSRIRTMQLRIENVDKRLNELRNLWCEINESEVKFEESKFVCPTCKRAFDAEDIDLKKSEMTKNFNEEKLKNLNGIEKEANDLKCKKSECELGIEMDKKKEDKIKEEIDSIDSAIGDILKNSPIEQSKSLPELLAEDIEYNEWKKKLDQLEAAPAVKKENIDDLKSQRQEYLNDISELKSQLSVISIIENNKKRILELQQQEMKLSQEKADLEKIENSIAEYIKKKVDHVTIKVNSLFSYVQFRMFIELINGGLEECCDCLIKGVPYSDANNGSKINAGIDIINVLSKSFGVSAPIFIDNAESVTRLNDTESQLIRLIVSQPDKKLRIEKY